MGKRSFQEAHGCPVAARAARGGCAGSQPGPGERAGPTDRLRLSAPRARPRDRRPEAARGRSGCGPSTATGAGVPGAGRASGAGSSRSAAGEGHACRPGLCPRTALVYDRGQGRPPRAGPGAAGSPRSSGTGAAPQGRGKVAAAPPTARPPGTCGFSLTWFPGSRGEE